jgi:ABC-type branched-subunit amino acid transport system ATPase component
VIDRRRVEICRGLIGQPKVLLLDEPSAGMTNDETRQNVNQTLAIAQQRYVLAHGRIIVQGSTEVLGRDPEVQRAYFGIGGAR